MSIIHDALKKVQRGLRDSPPQPFYEQPSSPGQDFSTPQTGQTRNPGMVNKFSHLIKTKSSSPALKIKDRRDTVILVICFTICVTLFLVILLLFGQNAPTPASQSASGFFPSRTKTAQPPAFETQTTGASDEIIVSGVVEMDAQNMALINDEIYEAGEMINGATIMAIENDGVKLLKDGKIRVVPVRGK